MIIEQEGYGICIFDKLDVGQCFTDDGGDVYLKVVDGSLPSRPTPNAVNLSNDTLYYYKGDLEVTPVTAEVRVKSHLKPGVVDNGYCRG